MNTNTKTFFIKVENSYLNWRYFKILIELNYLNLDLNTKVFFRKHNLPFKPFI